MDYSLLNNLNTRLTEMSRFRITPANEDNPMAVAFIHLISYPFAWKTFVGTGETEDAAVSDAYAKAIAYVNEVNS